MFRRFLFGCTTLLFLGVLCASIFWPAPAAALDGDYRMHVILSNQPSNADLVEVSATRQSNDITPKNVIFSWNGNVWDSGEILRTHFDICDVEASCTWTITVKEKSNGNPTIGSAGPEFVRSSSPITGSVAKTWNVTVPQLGTAPTSGTVNGRATFTDYIAIPIREGLPVPSNVPIKLTQTGGGSHTAETSTDSNGNFSFLNVPPGTYTVTAIGGYVEGTKTIPIDVTITDQQVSAGQTTAVVLNQTAAGTPGGPGSTNGTGGQPSAVVDSDEWCTSSSGSELAWVICPMINLAAGFVEKLDCQILSIIKINTAEIFGSDGVATGPVCGLQDSANESNERFDRSSSAYYAIWQAFRTLAFAVLIILGLIMVASQIVGLEIFSAQTIRKMLPKLILAAIFVPLSWEIMEFIYMAANASADAVMAIIKIPFKGLGSAVGDNVGVGEAILFNPISLILLSVTTAGAGLLAVIALLGPLGALALVASLAISILSVWILLEARNVVAAATVVFSAFAIVCAAYGPFESVFKFFKTITLALAISVPGIAFILAMSQGAAYIALLNRSYVVAMIIVIAGFAMLWGFVLQMDKATAFFGNAMSKVTGKAQKFLSDYRGNTAKRRMGEILSGQRDVYLPGKTGAQFGKNISTLARMASLSGKPGQGSLMTKSGREKLRQGESFLTGNTAQELLKRDDGKEFGNDDGVATGLYATDDNDFDTRYVARKRAQHDRTNKKRKADGLGEIAWNQGEALDEAQKVRKAMEVSSGAKVGTSAFQQASATARWTSVSAYNDYDLETDEGRKAMRLEMAEEMGSVMDRGLMTMTQVAATLKKNSQRTDISGHSFPQIMFQADEIRKRYKARKANGSAPVKARKMDEDGKVIRDKVTGEIETENIGNNLISDAEMDAWDRGAIEYTTAYQRVGQRTEAVRVQAKVMYDRVVKAVANSQAEVAKAQTAAVPVRKAYEAAQTDLTNWTDYEKRVMSDPSIPQNQKAQATADVRAAQERAAKAQQAYAAAQAQIDNAQQEVIRQVAIGSAEQTMLSNASPENARWFDKLYTSNDMPGLPKGTTIGSYVENLRQTSDTFARYERTYRQQNEASIAAGIAAAGGGPGGPGGGGGGPGMGGGPPSDRWLKRDIQHVGTAKNGTINLYRFKYLWDDQEYVGVMAQELLATHPQAVEVAPEGYYRVSYDTLDIPFLTYEEWQQSVKKQANIL